MAFFDAILEEPAPRTVEHRPPRWLHPPETAIPAAVALDLMLMRRDDIAIWIPSALVYADGVLFELTGALREPTSPESRFSRRFFTGPAQAQGARFGVGFSDGRKAELNRGRNRSSHQDAPDGAVLTPQRGDSNSRSWHIGAWLWPLPPAGELTFAIELLSERIAETVVTIDAEPLRAAAARAVELWPDDRPEAPIATEISA